nr:hypothetical protein [Tanacetum cinerariifolium]
MDHASKVLSMQEDEPTEVQEVVDVVTTAKLIIEFVTASSETVTAASVIISAAEPQVPVATITPALEKVDVEKVGIGVNAVDLQVYAVSSEFRTTVAVKQVIDVTRLQALVDKKKVVIIEATIRDALRLDDAEGVDCLPNEKIFVELARMGYEKPSTKLTFYKAFFSIQRVRKGFSGVKTPLFADMLVEQEIDAEGDADKHVEDVNTGDAAEGDDSAAHGEVPTVAEKQSIPSPTPPSPPPQPPQDRVKKLEKRNKVRVLKLRRLQKIGTSQRVETSDDTVMDDESNEGRMIAEMDQDDAVVLKDDKEENKEVAYAVKDAEEAKVDESAQVQGRQAESQAKIYKIDMDHANKVLSMQEDETKPVEVQKVVDVVTTAKLITEVVTAASETVTAASAIITTAEAQVPAATTATLTATPARDEQYDRELHAELNKDIDWDEAIDHVKRKVKEGPAVKRYQAMKRKPQTEAQARKNMMMYLKNVADKRANGRGRDQQTINETLAEKAAKRRKLNEEVEDLKRHLQIVPNEDDDIYTESTPLARKVTVVDYKIIEMNNKPYYKIIRADGTHQLYISFLILLGNFNREDLEALWSLVKERFSTAKPKNFSDDFLLTTLGAIFEKPDAHA